MGALPASSTTTPRDGARREPDPTGTRGPAGVTWTGQSGGFPTTDHLAGAFDELTAAGLLALDEPDPHGLRRVTLTTAGHTRYEQLVRGTPRPPGLPVPAPQFPAIKTPARERLRHSLSTPCLRSVSEGAVSVGLVGCLVVEDVLGQAVPEDLQPVVVRVVSACHRRPCSVNRFR